MLKKDERMLPSNYVLSRNKSQTLSRRVCSRQGKRTFNENIIKVCKSQERSWLKTRGKARNKEFTPKERSRLKQLFAELDIDKTGYIGNEELFLPFISLGLAHTREEITDLLVSAKFPPAAMLSFEDLVTLIRDAKNAAGESPLFTYFQEFMSHSQDLAELPLSLFLSNKRRQLMVQAFTADTVDDRKKGSKVLSAFATELKITPEPRRPISRSLMFRGTRASA